VNKKIFQRHNVIGDFMNILTISIRTVLFYFIVVIAYRLMGKREVSQLSLFDLIVSIIIAELIAMAISDSEKSIFISLLPIVLVIILQILIAYISLKNEDIRNLMDGKPSLIINQGKINFKEMVKNRYSLDDLLIQIREKSVKTINDIEYAILETNGKLSVFCYEDIDDTFPLPLILDGSIQEDNLTLLNKDKKWLLDNLRKYKIENIFYAFYRNKRIVVIKKD